jgi:hypothetical protein
MEPNMNKRTLSKILLASILAASTYAKITAAQVAPSMTTSGQMPVIKAQTLNERDVTLPADLPAEKTLVLIAFERNQQGNVNTWVDGLKLTESPHAWIETPVIDPRGSLSRAFIDGGMRLGIRDTVTREKTITLYTERMAFLKAMGLKESTKNIYVAVVNRAGKVLASVEGDYSAEKAALLISKWHPSVVAP